MTTHHNLAHALRPADADCRHDMREIDTCVICNRWLDPNRTHVDTCGQRCFKRLLEMQRATR